MVSINFKNNKTLTATARVKSRFNNYKNISVRFYKILTPSEFLLLKVVNRGIRR
jgi:hypothetical protein